MAASCAEHPRVNGFEPMAAEERDVRGSRESGTAGAASCVPPTRAAHTEAAGERREIEIWVK
jgi:hypothetical protein